MCFENKKTGSSGFFIAIFELFFVKNLICLFFQLFTPIYPPLSGTFAASNR
jgi:hypothetical protein